MDAAVKSGSLDLRRIISICVGRVACTIAQILLNAFRDRAQSTLDERVRRRFLLYAFIACARVDLPTSERTEVRRDLNVTGDGYQGAPVWNALKSLAGPFLTSYHHHPLRRPRPLPSSSSPPTLPLPLSHWAMVR